MEESTQTKPDTLAKQSKHDYWVAMIKQWEQSDASQPKFCARHNLNYTTFCYWRSRLKQLSKQADPHSKSRVSFEPVRLQQEASLQIKSSMIQICLPNRVVLNIGPNLCETQRLLVKELLGASEC